MQSMRITVWAVGLTMLMAAGCASSPTFTGQWHADKLPEGKAERALLVINEDQTFILTLEDAEGQPFDGETGVWGQQSPEQVRLYRDGPSNDLSPATAQLMDDGTLLFVAKPVVVEFRRAE